MPDLTITISGDISQAKAALQQLARELGKAGDAAKRATGEVAAGSQRATAALGDLRRMALQVAGELGAIQVARGLAGIARSAIQAAGSIEQLELAFRQTLRSGEAATRMLRDLQRLADRTPFTFDQLARSAQQLLAMGVAAGDVIPTMRLLADTVSLTGQATEERFAAATRAIGQMVAKGRISAEELNQLAENQIPAWTILADKLKLTQDQLQKIGSEGISAGVGLRALFEGFAEQFGSQSLPRDVGD